MITCQGLVRGIDISFTDKELLKFIESNRKIIAVKRLKRKISKDGELIKCCLF